ncbi:MAG: hypothetical protein AABY32_03310 [Nanoarchaeota archaeon]
MKIGFHDTDVAGGMIPMIIELKEKGVPYKEVNYDNLKLIKGLDLLIINFLGLPHFPKEILKDYCEKIKEIAKSNYNTKFLMMVPGEEWALGMNRRLGIQKNIDYVTDGDISKLTEIIGEKIK